MITKYLIIALLLIVGWIVNAQTYFGDQNIIFKSVSDGACSVFACDIDGDGDQDILSASEHDNKIAWYENTDGNGTFGEQYVITTYASNAKSVFACDIDGDGDTDVLSASAGDSKIAWYENTDGKGTFGEQQIITSSVDAAQLVFACDIDEDGDMDVLSASGGDDKIAWYENTDGKGTFGEQQIITSSADWANSVFACDIDSDGDIDVLSASWKDDKIAWYENTDGHGTFGAQQLITTSADGAYSVFACDIDGDGDADVLSASINDNRVAWYENTDGHGTFGAQQLITTSAEGALSVFACDMDGDGDADVLSAALYDSTIVWYENTNGKGTFEEQQVITTSIHGTNSVYACDMDGDGDPDILSASYFDDKIAWYENTDGIGTFGEQQAVTASIYGACSVFACDIDKDGDADVLSASHNDNKIVWFENTDGNGTFGAQQVITILAEGIWSVFASDIDGDGDMDVLSASCFDNKIAWYENTDGNGSFGAQQVISTSALGAESVYAIDIDGDGDMDILSASARDDKIAWYENTDGNGTFGVQQVISTSADGAKSVYACDIDGDEDMDVLSASDGGDSPYDDKIAWYENTDGKGTFGEQHVITTFVYTAQSVYACDIDSDGDQDVLSTSFDDSKIAWYENTNGKGTFGEQQVINTSGYGAEPIYACDMDGDGDLDVLSAFAPGNKITWYENTDGNGTFGAENVITTSVRVPRSVYACDIDGDGDPDVLSASDNDDKIAWYENFTAIIFTQPVDETICPGSDAVFSLIANDVETFQWQVDEGAGFTDLYDNLVYSGVTTDTLTISIADIAMNGFIYRCVLNPAGTLFSDEAVLTFDSISPEITSIHDDIIIDADSNCEAILPDFTGEVTATDNCDSEPEVTQEPIAGTIISGQANIVTLTVTDDMGNTDEVIFNVALGDTTNPTISCAGNQNVYADETHYYTVSGTELDPSESGDNCGLARIENDFNNSATLTGAQITEGTTTITWTIADYAGNEASCSFDINVTAYGSGIEKLQQKGISFYPNPTTGKVYFEFANNSVQRLTIFDITGNQIIEKTPIQHSESIDLSCYESGIYIICIHTYEEILSIKMMKE